MGAGQKVSHRSVFFSGGINLPGGKVTHKTFLASTTPNRRHKDLKEHGAFGELRDS